MLQRDNWGKIEVSYDETTHPVIEKALTWLAGEADTHLFEKPDKSINDSQVREIVEGLLPHSEPTQSESPLFDENKLTREMAERFVQLRT